jgi:hypothetical protein
MLGCLVAKGQETTGSSLAGMIQGNNNPAMDLKGTEPDGAGLIS